MRRWQAMKELGHRIKVVQPLPRTPGPFARGRWAELSRTPTFERVGGIDVYRPRYLHFPRIAQLNASQFTRVGLRSVPSLQRSHIVVADYAWPAAAAAPALRKLRIPCVVSGRGSDVFEVAANPGLARCLASYLEAAGHWVGVSAELVEAMDRLGGCQGRGTLVPNGVDLELFKPRDRSQARMELGLTPNRTVVLVVGHLIPRKDPVLALNVFRAGASEDSMCVFIGRGPLAKQVQQEARRLQIAERVVQLGEVSPETLAIWHAACNCLLLTSYREGRPNVVLEALASGRPVLATTTGGTTELLKSHPRLLPGTRDVRELAMALRDLLEDPPAPETLRQSAAPFTWRRSAETLEKFLDGVLEEEALRGMECPPDPRLAGT